MPKKNIKVEKHESGLVSRAFINCDSNGGSNILQLVFKDVIVCYTREEILRNKFIEGSELRFKINGRYRLLKITRQHINKINEFLKPIDSSSDEDEISIDSDEINMYLDDEPSNKFDNLKYDQNYNFDDVANYISQFIDNGDDTNELLQPWNFINYIQRNQSFDDNIVNSFKKYLYEKELNEISKFGDLEIDELSGLLNNFRKL